MASYLLDTDIISYLWDRHSPHHEAIVHRLKHLRNTDDVIISMVSILELSYGVKSFQNAKLKQRFEMALTQLKHDKDIRIVSLDFESAEWFSRIKMAYKKNSGIPSTSVKKNDLDLIIAALAIQENAILISNDKIFKAIDGLCTQFHYENWTSPNI